MQETGFNATVARKLMEDYQVCQFDLSQWSCGLCFHHFADDTGFAIRSYTKMDSERQNSHEWTIILYTDYGQANPGNGVLMGVFDTTESKDEFMSAMLKTLDIAYQLQE